MIDNLKKTIKFKILMYLMGLGIPVLLILMFAGVFLLVPIVIFAGDSDSDISSTANTTDSGSYIYANPEGMMQLPFMIKGNKFRISSGFGMRKHPISGENKMHEGIDIDIQKGTPILACDDGTIDFAGVSSGYGNLVIIKHTDTITSKYAHLNDYIVKQGQKVKKGQVIGHCGSTGNSTGPHLHFEINVSGSPVDPADYISLKTYVPDVLPEDLKYVEVNREKLKEYLNNKKSILAQDRYLDGIINAARNKGVNPLLLFAITGQEQSFVPKRLKNAEKIAANPFNVYHSWMEYNTNIEDSASIACNTIINLSEGRPDAINPIYWINQKYAEDKNWWIGVSKFFNELKEYTK